MSIAIDSIAILLCLVLAAIAALHAIWASGSPWPAGDRLTLSRMAVGARKLSGMPGRGQTLAVALAVAIAAAWPLLWAGLILMPVPQTVVWLGMWALAAVFLGRGIGGYSKAFASVFGEEPFATYNRRYYSPLCLIIGIGFLLLILLARV